MRDPARSQLRWRLLFLASGATALVYEVLWMRRLGLVLGGSALSITLTLVAFMTGLALGAALVGRLPPLGWRGSLRAYAALEVGAALWAVVFPFVLHLLVDALPPVATPSLAFLLMLPPATLLGATWPVVARQTDAAGATGLYAANTTGAMLGALTPAFVALPLLGLRASELAAAGLGVAVAAAAWWWSREEGVTLRSAAADGDGGAQAAADPRLAPLGAVDTSSSEVGNAPIVGMASPPTRTASAARAVSPGSRSSVVEGAASMASAVPPTDGAPLGASASRSPGGRAWGGPRAVVLLAAATAGAAALGLEVVWTRLAAVALGGSVHTFAIVLAAFLVAVAAGAWIGRVFPADPGRGLAWSLGALGGLALLGAAAWGQLPYGVALLYQVGGPDAMLPGSAVLAVLAMGGAPVASGMAFSCAIRCRAADLERDAPAIYLGNTLGCIVGAAVGGLWALPTLQTYGATLLFALLAAAGGAIVLRRPWPALPAVALALLLPGWDARLYAVGVHLRISDFADPSAAAIRRFADEGWDLLHYEHGATAAVAVGRSQKTGNVWLSTNGKVDASTGDDMPTQVLSGQLPVRIADDPGEVLVVGLASGVTAGAVLAEPGVRAMTVLEIEPAIVRASAFFDHTNGRPLQDPRTTLIVDDARAWLRREDRRFDVIVSEPSNPWITGVSNLFTRQYWELTRSRLREGGVMVQWVQLYGMGPEELRGLLRTFLDVYPQAWLFETIPGSDVLLIAAPSLPADLPLAPTLGPAALRRFAGEGWRNTDDRPRVELRAPFYLHYDTGSVNRARIEAARRE